jgi:hypothetical protein
MRIETIQTSFFAPSAQSPVLLRTPEAADGPAAAVSRGESIHLSPEGRELAVRTPPVKFPAEPLTTEHVAEIRRRILSGAYEAQDIVELVAGRVLSSGELRTGPAATAPGAGEGRQGSTDS